LPGGTPDAAKHAGEGARARIALAERARGLLFEVADDGHGFDPAVVRASIGLQNMTDRIGALGGDLTIRSAPGSGTNPREHLAGDLRSGRTASARVTIRFSASTEDRHGRPGHIQPCVAMSHLSDAALRF